MQLDPDTTRRICNLDEIELEALRRFCVVKRDTGDNAMAYAASNAFLTAHGRKPQHIKEERSK